MTEREHTAEGVPLFITRGLQVGVPVGGLQVRVTEDGNFAHKLTLHFLFDVTPTWLALACEHLHAAEMHWNAVQAVWNHAERTQEAADALEREFVSGMQAATAAAIAVDAFHAAVKTRISLPADLTRKWQRNGTARHRQIAEVLRQGFLMDQRTANALRTVLHDITRFRDLAVHPSGNLSAPHLHPDLKRGMEWRFVTYRFSLVKTLVSLSLSTLAQLTHCPRQKHPELVRYCDTLRPKVVELLYRFERRYGPQFQRPENHKGPPLEPVRPAAVARPPNRRGAIIP